MKNLVIDIGNSRVKLGLFEYAQLTQKWVNENLRPDIILEKATNHKVQNIILSTVREDLPDVFLKELRKNYGFWQLSADTPIPIQNLYQTPKTLGKDRLAAVVGATALYPEQACLVIDAGTCMTSDFINEDKQYLGGNISPGIQMRLRAMHEFTARLPKVETSSFDQDLGITTQTAMENGAVLGTILEIEALQERLEKEFPAVKTLLTGGDATVLAKRMKKKIFVHSNLVLIGLHKILEYNVQKLA